MTIRLLLLIIVISLSGDIQAQQYSGNQRRHWNKSRGYHPFAHATREGIHIGNKSGSIIRDIIPFQQSHADFSVTFRASHLSDNPTKRISYVDGTNKKHLSGSQEWYFYLTSSGRDTLAMSIRTAEIEKTISSAPSLLLTLSYSGETIPDASIAIDNGISLYSGTNVWKISVDPSEITVHVGNKELRKALKITTLQESFSGFGFGVSPGGELLISDISLSWKEGPGNLRKYNPDDLADRFSDSEDPMEGYWTIYDRTLDESLLKTGGNYNLAIVKEKDCYRIVYISGAQISPGKWEPGMTKGLLIPDPFPDTYSVIWYDSEGNPLSKDIKAQSGEGNTLLIQFPYHSSTLRLRHLPGNNRLIPLQSSD